MNSFVVLIVSLIVNILFHRSDSINFNLRKVQGNVYVAY